VEKSLGGQKRSSGAKQNSTRRPALAMVESIIGKHRVGSDGAGMRLGIGQRTNLRTTGTKEGQKRSNAGGNSTMFGLEV